MSVIITDTTSLSYFIKSRDISLGMTVEVIRKGLSIEGKKIFLCKFPNGSYLSLYANEVKE